MTVLDRITSVLPHGGSLPREVWERRHRAIVILLSAHVPLVVAFAVVRGYSFGHGLVESSAVAVFGLLAGQSRWSRGFRSMVAAVGLLTASAVLVHLANGAIEMHFHFFVMVGVLTLYQDWLPFLVAIGYVVLHHGVMGVLDPRSVYSHPAAWAHPWTWAAIHGGFVLAASAAYVVAWRMNEDARGEASESYRRLLDSESRFREAFENAPIGVGLVGLDGNFLRVNQALSQMLGRSTDDLVGSGFQGFVHPEDQAITSVSLVELGGIQGPSRTEQRYLKPDGRVVLAELSVSLVRDAEGIPQYLVCQIEDITDRRQAEAEVAFLAYHDKLTGLANRARLEDLLGMSLARAHRYDRAVAVLFLDLDDFKLVNDSLGHAAGDELLVQVADRLKTVTREADIVARQGGDEFLLLLADLDRGEPSLGGTGAYVAAESAAERIREVLRMPFDILGEELFVSASIGISVYPTDAADAAALLMNADTAMYWSKESGPAGFRVFAQEDVGEPNQLTLASRLRKGAERQDWTLHYQPLVELESRAVWGVEALLRWRDPGGGLISPGEFIPLAEEMGLIEAIGEWVVEELARQESAWREQGLDLEVSFNLSARQLRQRKLAERLLEPFDARGTDPHRVIVEITESAAMADPERTQWLLHEIRERGFRIAIDDFGTGYSSLSRLRHLPVDFLKVDLSFVRDIPADRHASSMVAGIIRLAEGVGMVPLAEGVESEDQRAFLLGAGCSVGQGYLFSRPVPAEEIAGVDGVVTRTAKFG
jgi:diguanylate cyclase (GGDEF)-like protein/PAS domain S-box-containing protein